MDLGNLEDDESDVAPPSEEGDDLEDDFDIVPTEDISAPAMGGGGGLHGHDDGYHQSDGPISPAGPDVAEFSSRKKSKAATIFAQNLNNKSTTGTSR